MKPANANEPQEFLANIEDEIQKILYGYIKAESFSYSEKEKEAEAFFLHYFSQLPYFKEHPDYFGAFPIANDPFHRAACYGMVKGQGSDTIVMIHHNDVVPIEDFKLLKPLAFSPDELEVQLLRLKDTFSKETQQDLDSAAWLYGRGVCDMKGGGAIQMALLSKYSQLEDFQGNLVVLAVPDEENLSAGMRSAVLLLEQLQKTYGLTYQLMINSEPHQRKVPKKGVFSMGSVGKIMPFIYVRGSLAHAGKVFEGFNPLNLMSEIVRKTELNMDLSDTVGDEAAPPPTWLFCKDSKDSYDVSMPLSATGCFSILTLNQTPEGVLSKVKDICTKAFETVLAAMNENYERFLQATKQPQSQLPWHIKVVDFAALCKEAYAAHGETFQEGYEKKLATLIHQQRNNEISLLACNFALVDYVYNYIDDLSPRVVYGLIPPYYPNVANLLLPDLSPTIRNIGSLLNEFTTKEFGQEYVCEHFYTGISDLSYTSISGGFAVAKTLEASMPLFGELYCIPTASIEAISMPCINIGPWGKDFHKLTERVLKEDLYYKTPRIIVQAISQVLGNS